MDKVRYCEYKLLVKADRLRSTEDFEQFWRKVKSVADHCDVDVRKEPRDLRLGMRRVLFYDTAKFDLYRNAFILRKRITMDAGFATLHETTFKFRHPELSAARAVDVGRLTGDKGVIKFKEEVLSPRDGSSGFRSVFSHNHVHMCDDAEPDHTRFSQLTAEFPALAALEVAADSPLVIVSGKTVEETGSDTGMLVFGRDYAAKSSIAIWRERATERGLIGEFSFQTRFRDREEIPEKYRERSHRFFTRLQVDLRDWLSVGSTKTALIYDTATGHE